jgi:malonate-semialdehyde dehydrogenase (acetylating) / methylmalonate-semialdehyde dehydrogenase
MTSNVDNYIGGSFVEPSSKQYMDVLNPSSNEVIGRVGLSTAKDVDDAVSAATKAFPSWKAMTIKQRTTIMLKFHSLIQQHAQELADIIVMENGKNITEALADVAKGNETVEWACNLPHVAAGNILRVSGNVVCQDRREPLGVVSCIVPFNFPFMVPMWTTPIALVMGNTVVLKPSEKVPLTMKRVAALIEEAGFPPGVFNMVQGSRETVEALIDHPQIQAVTFVGSSPVAKIVSHRCRALSKRCNALGGAKNHLVAIDDCDVDGAASDIVVSFAGCAGQRCMAASVLLTVGHQPQLVDAIVSKASMIEPGNGPGQMGPVIDVASYKKIVSYIEAAEKDGAKILLDGRANEKYQSKTSGNWIGPTIILHSSSSDKTMCEEVFGPVLSIYVASSWEEAIQIENASPFGNAASVYTTNGGNAEWFTSRFNSAMLGINIGIPVPREPFQFGGLYGTQSKYGDMDITGMGGMEFFSNRIKITSKWPVVRPPPTSNAATYNGSSTTKRSHSEMESSSSGGDNTTDAANFAGSM